MPKIVLHHEKEKTHSIFLVPSVTMTTKTGRHKIWNVNSKAEFGALAKPISGMDVQLHPPTWIFLLVAKSPVHILGLIYLADKV